ncbi:hypothetical protein DV737_g4326, partial [Chaetothyriales sp. CBS 132003]
MSAPSLAPYILKRPWLKRWVVPLANWYADAAGYRKLGLKADDLIPEENAVVQLALKRLPPKEAYDRVFRLRRAFQVPFPGPSASPSLSSLIRVQCSLAHQLLPPAEHTKPEDDTPYISPIIAEIEATIKEREDFDAIKVVRQ